MDPAISVESQHLVDEFRRMIQDKVGGARIELESLEEDVQNIFVSIASAVAEGGWNDVVTEADGSSERLALLSSLVEAVNTVLPTPAYPFVESWMALRAFDRVGLNGAKFGSTVADLHVPLSDSKEYQLRFPMAKNVETLIYLVPGEKSGYYLRALASNQAEFVYSRQPDATRPVLSLAPSIQNSGEIIANVSAELAINLAAEGVLLEASEMLGAGEALLQVTMRHTSEREQFGKKLTSFQGVSHRIAENYVHLETLRSLVRYASWVGDEDPDALLEYALMAKGYASSNCWEMANSAIQLHGAMGFTWEMGLQHPALRIIVRSLSTPSGRECLTRVGREISTRGGTIRLIA
jgi:hypothetical protein